MGYSWLIAISGACCIAACRTPAGNSSRAAEGIQPTARPRQMRTAKLPAKPRFDLRRLQVKVPGKTMVQVSSLLGAPEHVFKMEERESWDYLDIAYDSITKREVGRLEIWFTRGVAEDVRASF
jgi:hypothetical protein